jgi:hypothetical protein
VQVRLPEVRACLLDERHLRQAAPAQRVAQACGQLQPASAAADDDDAVHALRGSASAAAAGSGLRHRGIGTDGRLRVLADVGSFGGGHRHALVGAHGRAQAWGAQ